MIHFLWRDIWVDFINPVNIWIEKFEALFDFWQV